MYKGTEKWKDRYDFDEDFGSLLKDWLNSKPIVTGDRTYPARWKTIIAEYGLIGKPYFITSDEIETRQTGYPDKETAINGER
ncbi:MAG: hypothetical protein WAX69_19850 [Victivallales bacterium]